MAESTKQKLIRQHAAGDVTWHSCQEQGFADYVEVLGGLGELGLRPPVASIVLPSPICAVV
jgi:hypothetical protein